MSQWFDFSANANKLRQSYLKGFLDISGGGVYVRSDNSLNFYTTADGVNPKFALDATELHVTGKREASDVADAYHDVSVSKLAFIKDLSDNAQYQLDTLFDRTKFIRTTGESEGVEDATILEIDNNNGQVVIQGNLVPSDANTYDLGSSAKPFRNLHLKEALLYSIILLPINQRQNYSQ